MIPFRPAFALACALAIASPTLARPVGAGWRTVPAHGVTVHSGNRDEAMHGGQRGRGDRIGSVDDGTYGNAGFLPVGYWEANYGRQDDAAIFASRYGCARPIWNAKYNRYMAPCN